MPTKPNIPGEQQGYISAGNIRIIKELFNANDEQFNNKIAQGEMWLGAKGQPEILKDVLKELAYLGKPTIVSKDDFNRYKEHGAQVIYRGVSDRENAETELRDNEDVFIGRGEKLHGLFFTTNKSEAEIYKNHITDIFGGEGGSLIEAIIHPNAKIINISKLNRLDNEDRMVAITKYDKHKVKAFYNSNTERIRMPIIAALMGYDAIDMGHNVVVVLNRSSLIMRGDE